MRVCIAFVLGLFVGIGTAVAVPALAAKRRAEAPLQHMHGNEPGYVHGAHCIDSRLF